MKQTIRIIGGQFRGKKISFPDAADLRPTPDRVRETLFNWLMNDIRNARCLDAFAGSGALGLEAYSRGAEKVILLENSPHIYQHLLKVVSEFNSKKIGVMNIDAREYLQQTAQPFDLIFLDPPFAKNYLPECLNILAAGNALSPHGLVYVESNQPVTPDPEVWMNIKLKQAGQVIYALYKKTPAY